MSKESPPKPKTLFIERCIKGQPYVSRYGQEVEVTYKKGHAVDTPEENFESEILSGSNRCSKCLLPTYMCCNFAKKVKKERFEAAKPKPKDVNAQTDVEKKEGELQEEKNLKGGEVELEGKGVEAREKAKGGETEGELHDETMKESREEAKEEATKEAKEEPKRRSKRSKGGKEECTEEFKEACKEGCKGLMRSKERSRERRKGRNGE
ncbi:neurofilament light polypeptide-like [Drosophila albomicans]|uniref:Neurofilament light polypeptide-like n=1 Tax=Drosophila albomicans TaxID=7291 RepID=A0A6P8YGU6_DROAB|nr:neurofilament light polypeptide-like [Drosophila albomicans]